jgi:hypothetical protein
MPHAVLGVSSRMFVRNPVIPSNQPTLFIPFTLSVVEGNAARGAQSKGEAPATAARQTEQPLLTRRD